MANQPSFACLTDERPDRAHQTEGICSVNGRNIYDKSVNVDELRKSYMVFQKPNPFPKSIFENVAYGLRVNHIGDKNILLKESRNP